MGRLRFVCSEGANFEPDMVLVVVLGLFWRAGYKGKRWLKWKKRILIKKLNPITQCPKKQLEIICNIKPGFSALIERTITGRSKKLLLFVKEFCLSKRRVGVLAGELS
jgi:hypothetical protein